MRNIIVCINPLDGIQSMIPPMLFRYRSCNELSLQALWDDKIWLSKGNVMNDDYDALLYFDKAKITAHVLQAINEFSRFTSGKVSWEELPQVVQRFFPREVLCQMRESVAHITAKDMETYLRHFEAFSQNAIKAYSPKISVLTQNTLKFACFSDTITSANMWGHYASSSTGFSIGYNFRGFPYVDSVGEGNSELPTRCELFPIIYQSRRYDATPYAEWLLICSLVNDYFKTFSSQGNILDAAKILPCPDMLAPIKIMIHKSTEWKSEHEWRLMGTFATPALLSEEHTFVKKKASAIYLGRKISPIYARLLLDIAREKRIKAAPRNCVFESQPPFYPTSAVPKMGNIAQPLPAQAGLRMRHTPRGYTKYSGGFKPWLVPKSLSECSCRLHVSLLL